jgi:hypothetical protein
MPNATIINCKTQEEWDFLNERIHANLRLKSESWINNKENSCIRVPNPLPEMDSTKIGRHLSGFSSLNYYKKELGCEILSFEEWCEINNLVEKEIEVEPEDYLPLIKLLSRL